MKTAPPQSELFLHFLLVELVLFCLGVISDKSFVNVCTLCTLSFKEWVTFGKSKLIISEQEASILVPSSGEWWHLPTGSRTLGRLAIDPTSEKKNVLKLS